MTSSETDQLTELTQAVKTECKSQKDLFGLLPDELLLVIVQYVFDARTKGRGNHSQKDEQIITLVSEDLKHLHIFQHNPEAPIITEFQSFSMVDRRIHSLCQSFIWQSLVIPHQISRPISFWTQEILPKYALFIKEFYATLEDQWTNTSYNPISIRQAPCAENQHHFTFQSSDLNKFKYLKTVGHQPFQFGEHTFKGAPIIEAVPLDNHVQQSLLGIKHEIVLRKSPGLGPPNLFNVFSQCHNLTTLCLEFPPRWESSDSEVATNLSCNLTLLFSSLANLKHLTYFGPFEKYIPAESIIEPIKNLPLLETLVLGSIWVKEWGRTDCLARSISTLKNLKHLSLMHVDVIEESWIRHQAPPKLSKLVIHHYPNQHLSSLPTIINSWAPHITDFELKFDEHNPEYYQSDQFLPTFDPNVQKFNLPALTHLTIYRHRECESFQCFTDSPNIRFFEVRLPCEDGLSELVGFILRDKFPKLKEIVMPMKWLDSPQPTLDSKLAPLEDFCKIKGIDFKGCRGPKPCYVRRINA